MATRALVGAVVCGALVAWMAGPAAAAPTDYDTSFGTNGVASVPAAAGTAMDGRALAIDSGGRVLVAGEAISDSASGAGSGTTTVTPGPPSSQIEVARFTPAGALDTSWGADGVATATLANTVAFVVGEATDSTGGVLVGVDAIDVSSTTPTANAYVMRFSSTGASDSTFGTSGKAQVGSGQAVLSSLATDATGNIVVSLLNLPAPGTATATVGSTIDRLTKQGGVDSTFGSSGAVPISGAVSRVAVAEDGHILAAGVDAHGIALWRLTSTGLTDSTFGSGGSASLGIPGAPTSVLPEPDGSAVVTASREARTVVAKATSAGVLDTRFGDGGGVQLTIFGGSDAGAAGALGPDGSITVVGSGGTTGIWAARLHTDGSLDRTFGPNGRMSISQSSAGLFQPGGAPALQTDGKIVVAGGVLTDNSSTLDDTLGAARLLGGSGSVTPPANSVNRLAGADRLATAVTISQATFAGITDMDMTKEHTLDVVLVSADNFPDALVGTPYSAYVGGPLLLTHTATLDPSVLTEIKRVLGDPKFMGTVHILGGTLAVSSAVEQAIISAGYAVDRIAGSDRYQTAVDVANKLKVPTVIEATGTNFPDAVAAGAAGAAIHAAILLTNGSTQSSATASYLQTNQPGAFAVGGDASRADPQAEAIVGADRWETAVKVAERFFHTPVRVGVATGWSFADALAGGSRAAVDGDPVLLTDTSTVPTSVNSYLAHNAPWIDSVDVFGAQLAISDAVATAMQQAITEPSTSSAGVWMTGASEASGADPTTGSARDIAAADAGQRRGSVWGPRRHR